QDAVIEDQPEEETAAAEASGFSSSTTFRPGYNSVYVSAGETVYCTFKPAYSGTYVITSQYDGDTYGTLYNSSQSSLTSDDDSGKNYNFKIQYSLSANITYYIGVRFYSSSTSGTIPMVIASCGSEGTNNVTTSSDGMAYIAFTPQKSGGYKFYSKNNGDDTIGFLYDTEFNQLVYNDDYDYSNDKYYFYFTYNLDAGVTYYVGARFYSWGTGTIPVYIKPFGIAEASVSVAAQTYNGSARKPNPTVKLGSKTLQKGVDYKVSYSNNVNAGTATLKVTGIGEYSGTKSVSFKINPCPMSSVTAKAPARVYNGKLQRSPTTVKLGTIKLTKGTDYTAAYRNHKSAGKATIILTGKGNFTGKKTIYFTIKPRSVSKATVTVPSRIYNGKLQKSPPTVKVNGVKLVKGTDYTVSYRNHKSVGKATAIIKGINNYSGKTTAYFTIRKAAPKLTFSTKAVVKEKGNKAFTNKLTKTTDGKLTFTSSKKNVATVNKTTGKVTIKGKGVTTITVKAAAGKNYKAGKATYKLTVLKAGAFRFSRDNWNFTNSGYYFGYDRYIDQMNSAYITRLKNNLNNTEYQRVFSTYDGLIYYYWNGSCYGMAVTEFLAKKKMLPYGKYQSGATKLFQLNAPLDNRKVSSLITYYHMLQLKDVMQQAFYKYGNRSDRQNIQSLISLLKKNSTAVVCFGADNWGGHAVLATDYSYGSYEWFGDTYQGCIKICDPNYSSSYDEWANIYFNTSTYEWIIPAYYYSFGTWGKIDYVGANKNEMNKGGYLSGTASNTSEAYVARLDTYDLGEDHNVSKIRKDGDSYVSFDAGSGDIQKADSYIMNGGRGTTPGYNLYDSSSAYRVAQSRAASMDLSLKYEDSYLEAMSGAGMSAVFDRNGYVEIKGSPANCRLAATFDRDYPTDWFTVEITGNCGNTMSLRKTEQGYVVSGDRLKNVTVTANNKNDTVSTTFSTSAGEACVCQKADGAMDIRIDADHDGTFEKSIVR
ncbi:MAG: hypothetical protein Q4D81_08635, partial [Eubacteriales bacterium]|nr:hypothetical protein [Eubacteriales bacterium]